MALPLVDHFPQNNKISYAKETFEFLTQETKVTFRDGILVENKFGKKIDICPEIALLHRSNEQLMQQLLRMNNELATLKERLQIVEDFLSLEDKKPPQLFCSCMGDYKSLPLTTVGELSRCGCCYYLKQ